MPDNLDAMIAEALRRERFGRQEQGEGAKLDPETIARCCVLPCDKAASLTLTLSGGGEEAEIWQVCPAHVGLIRVLLEERAKRMNRGKKWEVKP